jgi:hypothetical protein
MDIDTISLVQKKIKIEVHKLKEHAIYSVDTMEKLQYIRGSNQIIRRSATGS